MDDFITFLYIKKQQTEFSTVKEAKVVQVYLKIQKLKFTVEEKSMSGERSKNSSNILPVYGRERGAITTLLMFFMFLLLFFFCLFVLFFCI